MDEQEDLDQVVCLHKEEASIFRSCFMHKLVKYLPLMCPTLQHFVAMFSVYVLFDYSSDC